MQAVRFIYPRTTQAVRFIYPRTMQAVRFIYPRTTRAVRFIYRYNRAVSSTPLLRAINLSIAVLVVALLAALYWYAWRPLPKTSGQIEAPISAKASISRDARGVPHISAASLEDAIFLQGYVTAQDRMWQMDGLRRLAAGELAEVVGPSALNQDRESHSLRLSRIAEAQAK